MTTEEPGAPASAEPPLNEPAGGRPVPNRDLQRHASGSVAGGMAGDFGDYLNVDPILLRVALAGLMIFGGAGLVLYVLFRIAPRPRSDPPEPDDPAADRT